MDRLTGTTLSGPFSLLLALLAGVGSRPSAAVYQAARSLLSFLAPYPTCIRPDLRHRCRTRALPGVLALLLHDTGVIGKLRAEALEDADPGPVQALRSAGAGGVQIAAHALLPSVTPGLDRIPAVPLTSMCGRRWCWDSSARAGSAS
ncbi:hypothetical protein WKI71_45305 [Streptomyces sp. MS1.AVA.1]|uniref:Uncharacterized protein n=1 Tax=Streptomyces machairae TaxID=3134109 RepID=A0ABU8UXP3_9ACTN